jgi:DNA-binding MarR family transcriptional regulator
MKTDFIKSDKIKIKILESLFKSKEDQSYYSLAKKTKTSPDTLKPSCRFLEALGLVIIKRIRTYSFLAITEKGKEAYLTLKKNIK